MQARGLIDTGSINRLLMADDRWHQRCIDVFPKLKLPLATTSAVLAAVFHLLGDKPIRFDAARQLLRSGAITVHTITDTDLPHINELMKTYQDRPTAL